MVGRKSRRLLQPDRNPILVELEPGIFQVRPDLLHVLHQAVRLEIELLQAPVHLAVGDSQGDRLVVQLVRFFVRLGGVGLLHQVGRLLDVLFLLRLNLLDLLADRLQIFRFLVVALVAMAAHAAALTEQIFAVVDGLQPHIAADQHHVGGVAGLAARFEFSLGYSGHSQCS